MSDTPTHERWLHMARNVQNAVENGWLADALAIVQSNGKTAGIQDEAREMLNDLQAEIKRQHNDASAVLIDQKPIRVLILAFIGAVTEEGR